MLAALVLASGVLTTVNVGANSEFRLRMAPEVSAQGNTVGMITGLDLDFAPYLRLESKSRHFAFNFAYAADVTLPDLELLATAPQGPTFFQLGGVSSWYASRHWLVGASEGGSFGQMNFSYLTPYVVTPALPASGPPPVQLIPCTDAAHCANETVSFGSSETTAMVRYSYRNTSFMIAPSYAISGGLDAPSRALVPDISMPRLYFGVTQQVRRHDELLTLGDVTAAESTQRACNPQNGGIPVNPLDPNPPLCAPSEQWVSLREIWNHKLAARIDAEFEAGATLARWTINETDDLAHANPAQAYHVTPYPVLGARITYSLQDSANTRPALNHRLTDPPKPGAYVYTRIGPVIDTHYGLVEQRLEIAGAVLQPINEKYTAQGRVGFVRSLWDSNMDATYVFGEGVAYRRIDKYRFDVGAGLRGAWQHDAFSGEFWALSVFVSLFWHEPRIVL